MVSDNSTDAGERSLLEQACAGLSGRGVTYVRPPEPLPMAEHWEWLWRSIREHTDATHVAYLTDRMVFSAGSLAALLDVVTAHPDSVVSYRWDHVDDAGTPVELIQEPWTGDLYELASGTMIELASRGDFGGHLPRLMDAIAPAAVLEDVEARFGDVFGTIAPDFRFAYRCLAVREAILYLDRPCMVQHGMDRSAGASFQRGDMNEDARRFVGELRTARFAATPDPALETHANAIFQEYCTVRLEVGGAGFPPPDPFGYLAANAVSVARIEDPEWRGRMRSRLEMRGWTRRHAARYALGRALRMAAYLARHPTALARAVKRQLWDRPPGSAAASLMARVGIRPRIRDELRFESDQEALAYAEAHPRPAAPYAWHIEELRRAGAIVARRR